MRPMRTAGVTTVSLLLTLAACDATETPVPTPASVASGARSAGPVSAIEFYPASFVDATAVDNRWFPLIPGTQMTWEGHALDGSDRLERKVVFTVTDLVKEIDGVSSVVIWERDYTDGELQEVELSFFAQDVGGSVWHLGEDPEEYENGEIVKHPTWIAGFQGSLPGIHMPANSSLDDPSYSQGWGPKVGWNDRGDTYAVGQHTCTPVDCYDNVLVIREYSRSEPGAYQLKYYAPGIGNVRVSWGGPNEDEHEVLVLTGLVQLEGGALADVRAKALAQEARAYEQSPGAYGETAPSEVRSG